MANEYWTRQWNPVRGCTKCSPACDHCYAERMARRFHKAWGQPAPPDHFKPTLHPEVLDAPLHWRKPQSIFVCNTSDLFHEAVPDAFLDRAFAVMAACPQHRFRLCTKRSRRMREYVAGVAAAPRVRSPYGEETLPLPIRNGTQNILAHYRDNEAMADALLGSYLPWPLPNVTLMVTAENQRYADERITDLLATPAAVRGVSLEPLLGPVDFDRRQLTGETIDPPHWKGYHTHLDWIILGGETGPGARYCDPRWLLDAAEQCKAAGVPVWFKQWGDNHIHSIVCRAGKELESTQHKPEAQHG